MKIALLIQSLTSGGAERQITELACGLSRRGHEVKIAVHLPGDFFKAQLIEAGVEVTYLASPNYFARIRNTYFWLKQVQPDVLHAYLRGSALMAQLLSLLPHRYVTVVSERSTYGWSPDGISKTRQKLYHLMESRSDWIVHNSRNSMAIMQAQRPHLRDRVSTIWNTVDLERFYPAEGMRGESDHVRFICVATLHPYKNPVSIAKAVAKLKQEGNTNMKFRWAGRTVRDLLHGQPNPTFDDVNAIIREHGIEDQFLLLGERSDIPELLRESDVFVLASNGEGYPNVVCEAMASGLPLLVSDVSDLKLMIDEDVNGFFIAPKDPDDIAEAMRRMLTMPREKRIEMAHESRKRAETYFHRDRFLDEHEALYLRLIAEKK